MASRAGETHIEVSSQEIPLTPDRISELAPSVPLHHLVALAPAYSDGVSMEETKYSFSNDESAAYFDQIQARTALPEYREAANRTAVVIGESSLMAALPFIAEDTIVVVDKSSNMCAFMGRYIDALRQARTLEGWRAELGIGADQESRAVDSA